jgi:hypothetical protein
MSAIDIAIGVLFAGGAYYLTSNIVFAIAILIVAYILYSFKVGLIVTLVIGSVLAYVIASYAGYPVNIFSLNFSTPKMPDLSSIGQSLTSQNNSTDSTTTTTLSVAQSTTTTTMTCNGQCCKNEDCKMYDGQFQFCCTSTGCNKCDCKLDGDCRLGYHCSADGHCAYGT